MKLVLSEEEQFLKDTAKNFAEERSPISHFRSLRDNNDRKLWDKDIWSEMVKLGWPGILIPEEFGGSNFGVTGIGVILQECAKTLTPSPLFATGVLGAYAISEFGDDDQKNNYLPKIVNGEITTALAVDETSHHDPNATELIAKKSNSGFTLSGKKIFVIEDHINMGALSSIIKEFAWENHKDNKITFINLRETFFRPGNFNDALQNTELASGKIYGKIINS